MASLNERQRWERWFDQVTARMERMKKSLVRLVAINTEAMAALEEIADDMGEHEEPFARSVAQQALDRIKGSAASTQVESVESIEEATPVEDPRRNK